MFVFVLLCFVFVVKSENPSNYYVVQMPVEDSPTFRSKEFNVYWNVPTIQCKSKKVEFPNLWSSFGIIQNQNDAFRGEKISILYDPGIFPALLKNETSGELKFRNGGVPQEGNLEKHLSSFKEVLIESIPDENFDGIGIIDFESWRPIYRQNFGVLTPYKDISYEIERKKHWWWPKEWIVAEATRRFEEAAVEFMNTTLKVAKQVRPKAKWGYYAYPYCFNMAGAHMKESCANHVPSENDKISWLWSESSSLYPSLYSSKNLSSDQLVKLIRGRLKEATRLVHRDVPILPYFWFKYREGQFVSEKDLQVALKTIHNSNASGIIIWGSSNDVNTKSKCLDLLDYVNTTLGPAVLKYTRKVDVVKDEDNYNTTLVENESTPNVTHVIFDPEIHWQEPVNYTQHIKLYVNKEFHIKDGVKNEETINNFTDENKLKKVDSVVDTLVNFLFKNKSEDLDQEASEIDESTELKRTTYQPLYSTDNVTEVINNDGLTTTIDKSLEISQETTNNYATTILNAKMSNETEDNNKLKKEENDLNVYTVVQSSFNNSERENYDNENLTSEDTSSPNQNVSTLELNRDKTENNATLQLQNISNIAVKSIEEDIINNNNIYEVIRIRHSKNKRKNVPHQKNTIKNSTTNEISTKDSTHDYTTNHNISSKEYSENLKKGSHSILLTELVNSNKSDNSSSLENLTFESSTKAENPENNTLLSYTRNIILSDADKYKLFMDMTSPSKMSETSSKMSTDIHNQKFFICIMYFYSIGRCLCYVYEHCS